jgi:endonuclease/exonuclease/phosphatase family metal-dependent hydrolase
MLLSIATWNCFGMAQSVFDALVGGRAPYAFRFLDADVKRAFEGHHIVCVQEILSADAEAFFNGLGEVRVSDPNRLHLWPLTLRGSGLGVAARHPIAATAMRSFATRSSGWDRFARKGVLHVRVRIDGIELDVVNAHLQSGYDPRSLRIRAEQLAEVARCVNEVGSRDRPFIVCGDFNVCGLGSCKPDYALLRNVLDGFDDLGARDDLPTFDPHPERNTLAHEVEPTSPTQRLDYIFVRGRGVVARSVARILDRPLTSARLTRGGRAIDAYASDHFALVASLEIA